MAHFDQPAVASDDTAFNAAESMRKNVWMCSDSAQLVRAGRLYRAPSGERKVPLFARNSTGREVGRGARLHR